MKSKDLLKLIPNKVRITRSVSYEVLWVDSFQDPKQLGECRPDTKQILIGKKQSNTEAYKTYLHETIHAASFETKNLNLTETQTQELEKALFRFLKLNKFI